MIPEPEDGQIIFHALGLEHSMKPYRKYYIAPALGEIRKRCERMAYLGWLVKFGAPDRNGMQCFHVTASGAKLIGHNLP